ncbi:MAG: hypothetical protein ISS26_02350 [Candidatus Omnitrophica bacterium]|nr:hypothetical protein [Candidatus Omnitrophota bacterium]
MMIPWNRRTHYLVNKRIQLQFVVLLLLLAIIPIVLLGSSLYIVNKTYLYAMQRIMGETMIADVDIQGTLSFSVHALTSLVVITAILLSYIGIRFSHHIAGPVYKMEETIDKLVKGEKVDLLHFRKNDSVNDLAGKFNILIKKMHQAK